MFVQKILVDLNILSFWKLSFHKESKKKKILVYNLFFSDGVHGAEKFREVFQSNIFLRKAIF